MTKRKPRKDIDPHLWEAQCSSDAHATLGEIQVGGTETMLFSTRDLIEPPGGIVHDDGPKRVAYSAKTPQGWRKMSSVPHDVEVEVKFTTDGTISSPAVKARVDAHGFYLGKVYWARFAPDGTDRLAAWRPLK